MQKQFCLVKIDGIQNFATDTIGGLSIPAFAAANPLTYAVDVDFDGSQALFAIMWAGQPISVSVTPAGGGSPYTCYGILWGGVPKAI